MYTAVNVTLMVAEGAEGRSLAKGNPLQDDTDRMQSRRKVNSALRRIRQAAERDKKVEFTSLMQHIYSVDMLREAYFSLKRRPHRASTGRPGSTTGRDWKSTFETSPNGWPGVPTERARLSGCMYQSRMVGNGRSGCPYWKTSSSRGRRSRY